MQQIIVEMMDKFGYLGVFLLITVENVFPPIPSELILTFGGFITISSSLSVLGVIISATLGSVLGAVVLYVLGRALSKGQLERLFESRIGKILRLKKADADKTGNWFSKYGYKAVFLCRFIPVIRSLISIPAGMAKMNMKKFLLLTTLGTLIWNTVLVSLGRLAGEAWEKVIYYFDFYTGISMVVMVVAILLLAVLFIRNRFFQKAD